MVKANEEENGEWEGGREQICNINGEGKGGGGSGKGKERREVECRSVAPMVKLMEERGRGRGDNIGSGFTMLAGNIGAVHVFGREEKERKREKKKRKVCKSMGPTVFTNIPEFLFNVM
jgi:hypothetical protein